MKKYLIGLLLILLIAGCQQKETITTEPSGEDIITEPPPTEAPPVTELPTETGTETEETTTEAETLTTNEVSILGKAGFEPVEITVKKGDTIIWANNDPAKKTLVLTFQKGKKFITSSKIEAGKTYEQIFDEEGTYDYWAVSYGARGKVIIE